MWSLWQKATKYSKLPSEVLRVEDELAAWMLDNAVTWFGITIENLLDERVEIAGKFTPKYSLARLLHEKFKLPRPIEEVIPEEQQQPENPWAVFLPWIGKPGSGVHRYVYVPPKDDAKEN